MQERDALVESLRKTGALRSARVEDAFRSVDQRALLPPALRALAYADAPVPYDERLAVGVSPSPQVLAAMLEVLELEPGVRTAVVGGGPYPAYLAASIVGDALVAVVEPDASVRQRIASLLVDRTTIQVAEALEGRWDRLWVPPPDGDYGSAEETLDDMGFVVARAQTPEGPAVLKRIRSGVEFL